VWCTCSWGCVCEGFVFMCSYFFSCTYIQWDREMSDWVSDTISRPSVCFSHWLLRFQSDSVQTFSTTSSGSVYRRPTTVFTFPEWLFRQNLSYLCLHCSVSGRVSAVCCVGDKIRTITFTHFTSKYNWNHSTVFVFNVCVWWFCQTTSW